MKRSKLTIKANLIMLTGIGIFLIGLAMLLAAAIIQENNGDENICNFLLFASIAPMVLSIIFMFSTSSKIICWSFDGRREEVENEPIIEAESIKITDIKNVLKK